MTDQPLEAPVKPRFCRHCGAGNRASASFCRTCGEAMTRSRADAVAAADDLLAPGDVPPPESAESVREAAPNSDEICGTCGAALRTGARFCRVCGAASAADGPAPETATTSPRAEIPLFVAPIRRRKPPPRLRLGGREWAVIGGAAATTVVVGAAAAMVIWNGGLEFSNAPYKSNAHDHVSRNVAWVAPNDSFADLAHCSDEACFTATMKRYGATRPSIRFSRRIENFFGDKALGYAQRFSRYGKIDLVEVFVPGFGMEGTLEYLVPNGPSGLVNVSDFGVYQTVDLMQDAAYRAIHLHHPGIELWPDVHFSHAEEGADGGEVLVFDASLLDGCHACSLLGVAHYEQRFDRSGRYVGLTLLGVTPEAPAEAPPQASPPAVPAVADTQADSVPVAPPSPPPSVSARRRNSDAAAALVRETLQAAKVCLAQENYDCAEADLKTVLRAQPQHPEAAALLAEIQRKRQAALQSSWNAH